MRIRNLCVAVIALLSLCMEVRASHLQPSISLLGNYVLMQNNADIRSGIFDIQNKKFALGFEVNNKFELKQEYFFRTGLRYAHFGTTINGENQIPELFDKPYPLTWERRYDLVCIPLILGKEFTSEKGMKSNVFLGLSAGVLMTGYSRSQVSTNLPKNAFFIEEVSSVIVETGNPTPSFFFTTIDIGAGFQPFKIMPRFNIGILVSAQINKVAGQSFNGVVRNEMWGTEYKYDIIIRQRYVYGGLMLNYQLSKPVSAKPKRTH